MLHPLRTVAEFGHPVISKYLRDRGPHLAAMVAYYALLSLVPFLFLTASLLGFAGHVSPSSYLIRELAHILPGQSARDLLNTVRAIQRDAGTLGAIGFFGLVWGTLGLLLGARVGAEHRLRRAEPHVPAPEVGHVRARHASRCSCSSRR